MAFVERMVRQLGREAPAFLEALEASPRRGLRLNPRKALPSVAEVQGLQGPIPWEPLGSYLSLESSAGSHPLHEAGAYYLQEPSAMIPARVLCPRPGERVLDLCAAPGGKATQLADGLAGQGLLVCNEPVPSRAQILSRNVERMGIANALVVSADPEALARAWPSAFDAVLVDAPCSGEGMFRRHPETRLEWNESAAAGCAQRQRRILASAHALLAPGGRLAYSTCTFSPEENQERMAWFQGQFPDMKPQDFTVAMGPGKTLASSAGMLALYPHHIQGEGHFVALLQKEGHAPPAPFPPARASLRPPSQPLLVAFEAFCAQQATDLADTAEALPRPNAQLGETALFAPPLPPLQGIRVLRAGLHLGLVKGKIFVPDHGLALCLRPPYPFPTQPLTLAQARAYQSGETLAMEGTQRGYALMTYAGLPLGFAKASDGQLKNHYPKGLRRP